VLFSVSVSVSVFWAITGFIQRTGWQRSCDLDAPSATAISSLAMAIVLG
jgi:hypothetical protein